MNLSQRWSNLNIKYLFPYTLYSNGLWVFDNPNNVNESIGKSFFDTASFELCHVITFTIFFEQISEVWRPKAYIILLQYYSISFEFYLLIWNKQWNNQANLITNDQFHKRKWDLFLQGRKQSDLHQLTSIYWSLSCCWTKYTSPSFLFLCNDTQWSCVNDNVNNKTSCYRICIQH